MVVDGAVAIGVQLAPGHQPPVWPDGAAQQVHLDLYVDDITNAHDRATSAGARLLQVAASRTAGPVAGQEPATGVVRA